MATHEALGYKVIGIVVRTQKHRKQTSGRKRRSVYEGKYVYVRVRLVDGRRRDFYLGSDTAAAASSRKTRVEKPTPASSSSSSSRRGGETEWRSDGFGRSSEFPRRARGR